ncbi:RNA polymerase sigma factor [Cellulomonas hominis]
MHRLRAAEREHGPEGSVGQGADDLHLLDRSDAESFTACFRSTYLDVHTFVLRVAGADLVDDIVAETFASVWARWASIPGDSDGRRAWVFGVARNKIREAQRSMTRRRRLVVRLAVLGSTSAPVPQESVLALDRARAILGELPVDQRDAVCLTVLAGLSCAEAADVLGCSVSAVTSRVTRARVRMQERLASNGEEDGGER